jgi:hypothetical protein
MKRKKKRGENNNYKCPSNTSYKTFKLPLKAVLKQTHLLPEIEILVYKINNLVTHAYQFIRLYVILCYENNNPVTINDEFIRYSLKTLGFSRKTKDCKNKELLNHLEWFYMMHYQPIFNHVKIDLNNCSAFIANISIQIETMISNNIKERFEMHLKRFINITFETMRKSDGSTFTKSDLTIFKRHVLSWNFEGMSQEYNQWFQAYGIHLFNLPINKSIYYHLEAKPLDFLKPMFLMSKHLECLDRKIFQFFPLRSSNIPANLLIDSISLMKYFYDDNIIPGVKKSYLTSHVNDYKFYIWGWFLNFNHKVFRSKRYCFFCQIQTDGISCSLIFKRKDIYHENIKEIKRETDNFKYIEDYSHQELEQFKNTNLIGCDPGKRSLVYMTDNSGKTLQYTAPQRRFESKAKFNQKITEKLRKQFGIEQIETYLSDVNSRTTNFNKFKEYILKKAQVSFHTQSFYNHPTFRKMKLRTFIEGKRSEDKFVEKIGEIFGQNSIIMYGDWSESEQMKNFIPTKGVGLRRLIHRNFLTISIKEAYSSKRCCECFQDLRNYIADNNFHRTKIGDKIHRILVCDNCIKCSSKTVLDPSKHVSSENKRVVFRTRDKNAARNILRIGEDWIFYRQRRPAFTNTSNCFFHHPNGIR